MIYELRRSRAVFNIPSIFACALYIFLHDVQLLSTHAYTHSKCNYVYRANLQYSNNLLFCKFKFTRFVNPRRVKCGNSRSLFILILPVQESTPRIKGKRSTRSDRKNSLQEHIWRERRRSSSGSRGLVEFRIIE